MASTEDLTKALDDLVVDLNAQWKLHQDLFQVDEHYMLFARSGPMVWHMLGNALIDSVFMSAARLLDPPRSVGKDNLSFKQIIVKLSADRSRIEQDYERLQSLYDSALRHWRNRKLSHNDLMTITGVSSLPKISYKEIADLVDHINKVARLIGQVVRNIDQQHVPFISNQDWVWQLIQTLKAGTEYRQQKPKDRN
jgi:hypothetical protein